MKGLLLGKAVYNQSWCSYLWSFCYLNWKLMTEWLFWSASLCSVWFYSKLFSVQFLQVATGLILSYRGSDHVLSFKHTCLFFLMLGIALVSSNWASYIFDNYVNRHVSCVHKGHCRILIDLQYRYKFFQIHFFHVSVRLCHLVWPHLYTWWLCVSFNRLQLHSNLLCFYGIRGGHPSL